MLNLENWAWTDCQLGNIAKRAQLFNLHDEKRKSEKKKEKGKRKRGKKRRKGREKEKERVEERVRKKEI